MDEYDDQLIGISSKNTRLGFIRKVYVIVSYLIGIVAAFVIMGCFLESYRQFIVKNPWIFIVAIVAELFTGYALVCYKSVARSVPGNYIYLTIYALSTGVLISPVGLIHYKEDIAMAAGMTAILVFALTIYAFNTKTDFTTCGAFLFCFLVMVVLAGIMLAFFPSKIAQIGLSLVTILLFSLYLIYDTQLLVGGKEYQYSMDDYIVAALQIFIDIVRIFLEILKILAATRQ